jgi:hypothetical protein
MGSHKLLDELKANPKNIRFKRVCQIAEAFGFQTRKSTGSHRVYYRDGVREMLMLLSEREAPLDYTAADAEGDLQTLEEVLGR